MQMIDMKRFILCCMMIILAAPVYAQHDHMDMGDMPMPQQQSARMRGMYGSYPATREGSGTSWQPDSTPQTGSEVMLGDWMAMYEGYVNGIYTHQGGGRGAEKGFSTSMAMFMLQRSIDNKTLGLRGMVSLDPAMGKKGYPLLLQTGETYNGTDPLIDRQHPHDLFMELAVTTGVQVDESRSFFVYAGLPGEPALGPPAFMHRFSSMHFPDAPITHHWFDSTHITYGVMTAGYVWDRIKTEVSAFKGREPDQDRWDIESPELDSYAARISYNPTGAWSFQTSYGHIDSPEQLHSDVDTGRLTASAIFNKKFDNNNWQTMAAWGENMNDPGNNLYAFLLESALRMRDTHTFFVRLERVQKDELFHDDVQYPQYEGKIFDVNRAGFGYIYDFPQFKRVRFGVGGSLEVNILPSKLHAAYGSMPKGYMIFGRLKF